MHVKDRNFDDIADKFTHNIYGTHKGLIRQHIVWQDIEQLLQQLPNNLRILDAGGGEGRIACRLAAMGHQVILCDISSKMLARAQHYAKQQSVTHNMQFIESRIQDIQIHITQPVDLIICHAVLEWISEPQIVLYTLLDCLRRDGVLSLMFFNIHALLLRNIVLGNLGHIGAGMHKKKRRSLVPTYPLKPEQVYSWLKELNMAILSKTGVRVFYDYLHKQDQQNSINSILALEQQYCRQEPFIHLGRYIHVLAVKS